MKLFINSGSPFARKVRIVVRETGRLAQAEEIFVAPVESPPALVDANPMSQIPALTADDGTTWSDSTLICAWLAKDAGPGLIPGGDAFWAMRRFEVAGVGLIETMVKMVLENRRPENEHSAFWLQRWETGLMRGFAAAEAMCPAPDVFNMGSLTMGVAATYCEFRYPHIEWRALAPKIAALTTELEKRPSFIDTFPK